MPDDDALPGSDAIERIKELKYSYFRACDAKDPVEFRNAFVTEGSHVDYGPLGSTDAEGMCAVFREFALATDADGQYIVLDMHHGIHPIIRITGPARATGRWTLRFRSLHRTEATETVLSGEYDDVYVLENGNWKIQSSSFRTTWRMTKPLPEGARIETGW